MRRYHVFVFAGLVAIAAFPALAQTSGMSVAAPTMAPAMSPAMPAAQAPADHAFMSGMDKMNAAMKGAPLTGDADRDFVAMMLPHHKAAVDMAKTELHYGKDPTLRVLARNIIAAQDKEIIEMRSWQAKHPAK